MTATIAEVRALIPDLGTPPIFSDTEIQNYINLAEEGNAYLAAASAVEAIATQMAITYVNVRTDDLSVDASKNAAALFARADRLRDEGDEQLSEGFQIIYPAGCGCVSEATPRPCRGC